MDNRTVISNDQQRLISGGRKRRSPRLIGRGEPAHHKGMDHGAPMSELEAAVACPEAPLQHIRDHAAVVSQLRESVLAPLRSDQ